MVEPGSALEPDNGCMSDAYCNGSGSGIMSNKRYLPAAKLGDVLSVTARSAAAHTDDVYSEDSDLQLAAQHGIVLLQDNEELRHTNQQLIEEFSEKIEVIL